jgi:hypothetical protein
MNENIVPDHIIDFYSEKYQFYPCFTQTKNVIAEAVNVLTKKNKIVWFNKLFNGNENTIREALIDYSSNYKIMIYVKSKEKENVYKLVILSSEDGGVNVDFLLKGLNKFYTIDIL